MTKLTDLLKKNTINKPTNKPTNEIIMEKKVKPLVSPKTPSVEFFISDEDLEKVSASVVEIDTTNKTRE